jgi:hypothetical protein
VSSIFQDDYSSALDGITRILANQLREVCVPEPIARDTSGKVACHVIWELPTARVNFDTPIDCSDRPELLRSLPELGDSGGKRCLVEQLPVHGTAPESGDGWYYDDSSEELPRSCRATQPQRAAFIGAAVPPTGVTVTLECWPGAMQVCR